MKKIVLLLLIFTCTINFEASAQENEVTTYYFIRHAEKVRKGKSNDNPSLKRKGIKRAKKWSVVFENIPFDVIYSTNYKRTIQTATPTAKSKDLEVQFYNPRELYSSEFKDHTKGKTVLVVGHSNTTPQFVNKILGIKKYAAIEDNNNANLYILTISDNILSDALLKID